MRSVRLIVLVAALWQSGCSLLMSKAPDPYDPQVDGSPDCTASRGAPIVDSAGAAYGLTIGGLGTLLMVGGDDFEPVLGALVALTHLPPGVVYTVSASTGFSAASECRDARAEFDRYYQGESGHRAPPPESRPREEEGEEAAAPPADEEPGQNGQRREVPEDEVEDEVEDEDVDELDDPEDAAGAAEAPPIGAEGGACTPGGACDEGLACDREDDVCRPEDEVPDVGSEGGRCTAGGACDPGLACDRQRGICRPEDEVPTDEGADRE